MTWLALDRRISDGKAPVPSHKTEEYVMKTLAIPFAVLAVVGFCNMASAQVVVPAEPVPIERPADSAQTKAHSQKWQSMSQTIDPKWIVQQNAAMRGAQRRSRLAAMKWYGLSNARPAAAATPFTGVYSNTWVGSGLQPFAWSARSAPSVIVVQPERPLYDR